MASMARPPETWGKRKRPRMRPLRRQRTEESAQWRRVFEPPDDAEDRDPDEDPPLERADPDDRPADEPEDDRDGARADEDEDRPDGELRYEEEGADGDPDPMLRPDRDDVVRGTMTGRDEPIVELGRPPPTRGETGCRTRGDVDGRVLGRDDELRVLGRRVVFRVLGWDTEFLVEGIVDDARPLG